MSEEGEATLSISLIDGISCGLAGALLLFVIFGVNLSASTSALGGQAGQGTVTRLPSGLKTEPADIVVEVEATSSGTLTSPWTSQSNADDRIIVNTAGRRTIFIRELPKGFKELDGDQARSSDINFRLEWQARRPPKGTVHIFRSGTETSQHFECQQRTGPYAIITGYELLTGIMAGECS